MMRQGYLCEFGHEKALLAAVRVLRAKGYTRMDAFTPHPVKELDRVLGLRRSKLALITFPIAVLGGATGFLIQWYCNARSYPLDVGGRPLDSWPAFIPITFESTVLTAGITAFVLFLLMNRYPEPSHPVLAVDGFERASVDRFWLGIDRCDPHFDTTRTAADLSSVRPLRIAGLGMESP